MSLFGFCHRIFTREIWKVYSTKFYIVWKDFGSYNEGCHEILPPCIVLLAENLPAPVVLPAETFCMDPVLIKILLVLVERMEYVLRIGMMLQNPTSSYCLTSKNIWYESRINQNPTNFGRTRGIFSTCIAGTIFMCTYW